MYSGKKIVFKTSVVAQWAKKSACQCRGHRFNPWFEKTAHGEEQLSPCVTTEPTLLRAGLPNKRSHC